MGYKLSIAAVFLQCIISSTAIAGTGHTGNNGGGLGEIHFTDIWKNLKRIMAPCLSPLNLCGLTEAQLQTLRAAFENRPEVNTEYSSRDFYADDGKPLSPPELTRLAVASVLKCEALLTGIHPQALTKNRALTELWVGSVQAFKSSSSLEPLIQALFAKNQHTKKRGFTEWLETREQNLVLTLPSSRQFAEDLLLEIREEFLEHERC